MSLSLGDPLGVCTAECGAGPAEEAATETATGFKEEIRLVVAFPTGRARHRPPRASTSTSGRATVKDRRTAKGDAIFIGTAAAVVPRLADIGMNRSFDLHPGGKRIVALLD
jgi:hypothetical protein